MTANMSKTTTADTWNADTYISNASFVASLGNQILELLAPQSGQQVLDLGCGDGQLTAQIAARGASVVAVDSSEAMVAKALTRGLDARVMSGDALTFDNEFDAVFSNAALHWMKSSNAVIACVLKALKDGGRFVAECGGVGNIRQIQTALENVLEQHGIPYENPWIYHSIGSYSAMLEAEGFRVDYAQLIPRPTKLDAGMRGWLETFTGSHLASATEAQKNVIFDEVCESLEPELCREGTWWADYVRLRFIATRR